MIRVLPQPANSIANHFSKMAAVGIELTEWAVFDVFQDKIINNQQLCFVNEMI